MRLRRAEAKCWIDIGNWAEPDVFALDELTATDYEKKASAIKQYAAGAPLKFIEASTGISRQYLYYLIDRCQVPDVDGRPIGFDALIKGRHLCKRRHSSPSKLTAGSALPGSLQALFARYPNLEKLMFDLIVHRRMPGSKRINRRLTWAQIQEEFENQCVMLGIHPPNYPFSSNLNGAVALKRWGNKLRMEQQVRRNRAAPLDAEAANPTDLPGRCYERVECDGHYVDLDWIIEVPGLRGEGVVQIKVKRLWLIALLETRSSAVIGYSISLNKSNYSAADISRAIRSSLVPWVPRQLSISTISYKPGECLPNALDSRLSYICYDEIWLDNAKSHFSSLFMSVLERTVNAVPVFGPRASPNVRPNVEMVFDLIEEAGIHPLDGTTGANHKDPRKSKKQEDRYLLTLEVVLDLIDLLVVRYNTGTAPGTTISRLEVLKRVVERETTFLRPLSLAQRQDCLEYDLFDMAYIGIERGAPVLRWSNARYDGPGLHSIAGLVGREVLVKARSLDLRKISVSLTSNGTSLGILEVEQRWRGTPQSVWARGRVREVMSYSSFLRHAADIPNAMRAHAEKEAKKNATAKRQLAQLISEQQIAEKSASLQAQQRGNKKESAEETTNNEIEEIDAEVLNVINKIGSIYR